jgi:cell division protein FtsL
MFGCVACCAAICKDLAIQQRFEYLRPTSHSCLMYVAVVALCCLLQLPLPLHLATSVFEWLLIYTTSCRLDAAYSAANNAVNTSSSSSSSSSGGLVSHWLHPAQLLLGLLCVVLLPTLGVVRLQQQQRAAYDRLKAAESKADHTPPPHQQKQQEDATASSSSIMQKQDMSAPSASSAAVMAVAAAADASANSCGLSDSAADDSLAAISRQLQQMMVKTEKSSSDLKPNPDQTLDKPKTCGVLSDQQQQHQIWKVEQARQQQQQRRPFLDDSSYDRDYVIMTKGRVNSNASSREPSPEKTLAGWLAGTVQQQQPAAGRTSASTTASASASGSSSSSGSSLVPVRSFSGPLLLAQGESRGLRRCDSAQGSLAPKENADVEPQAVSTTSTAPTTAPGPAATVAAATPSTASSGSSSANASAGAAAAASSSGSASSSRRKKEMRPDSRRDSAAERFLADIESSMTLAAPAAAAATSSSSSSSRRSRMHGLMPALSGLLGDEGAAAVFLAAASAAAPAGPGAGAAAMPFYTSMAQALPASIKVGGPKAVGTCRLASCTLCSDTLDWENGSLYWVMVWQSQC